MEYSLPKHDLTEEEKKRSDELLKLERFRRIEQMSESAKIYSELLRLKYNISDYLELEIYDVEHSFGSYLKKYVKVFGAKRKEMAANLSIHETKFSRLIHDKENPGLAILYRIEEHSNGVLQADLLWNLVTRKVRSEIKTNRKDRKRESRRVKNKLRYEKVRL